MDPNNLSDISIRDDLEESGFSAISSVGTDLKQILEKLKKLEAESATNKAANQCGGSSSSTLQIGFQLGKMENQMAAMAKEIDGLRIENVGLKAEIKKFGGENEKMKNEFGDKNAEIEGKIAEKDRQMAELKDEMRKLKEEMGEKLRQKAEKDALTDLSNQLIGMQEKQTNESGILTNLTEQLARIEGRFKLDLMNLKENKFNSADCGPKFSISEEGRVVKYSGSNSAWNSVRAQMAIPKLNLSKNVSIAYFEVEIVANPSGGGISIGFCTQQFPLEGNYVGAQNSIGIYWKKGINIDGKSINFENGGGYFQQGEIIGIGIAYFPAILSMKCFATRNSHLLGKVDLPKKFADLELFPAVSMLHANDSIRANFGANPWKYNTIPEQFAN